MPSFASRSMLGVGMPRPIAAAIGPEIAVAGVVGDDHDDVGLLRRRGRLRV